MMTAGDHMDLHGGADGGLGRIDARDHDQTAERRDQPHQDVDQHLDEVDRNARQTRGFAIAADRTHMQAELRVVEQPAAEKRKGQGDDDGNWHAEKIALAEPGERGRQTVMHIAGGMQERQAAQAHHHGERRDEGWNFDNGDQKASQTTDAAAERRT